MEPGVEFNRYEDLEDMISHTQDKLADSIFHYCMCMKGIAADIEFDELREMYVYMVEQQLDHILSCMKVTITQTSRETMIDAKICPEKLKGI